MIKIPEYSDKIQITLSIGLSEGNGDIKTVIDQADSAMYVSKKQEKNKINFYKPQAQFYYHRIYNGDRN